MRRLVPIVIAVLLFSACKLKVEQGFELNADGSGEAFVVTGFDDEMLEFFEESAPGQDPFVEQDLPPGWTSEEWSQGEFTGVRAKAPFANVSGLEALISSAMTGEDGFFDEASIGETAGGFRFEATLSGESFEQFEQQGFDSSDVEGQIEDATSLLFDLSVAVTMPGEITSHNADLVDGSTLIWDLALTDAGRVLRAESSATGESGLPVMPLAGGVLLLVLAAAAFFFWRRRETEPAHLPAALVDEPVPASYAPVEGDPFA